MSKKILIIVENLPVPFDTRVWKEATSLHEHGYDVTVLCPKGKGHEKGYELIEGVRIYRHAAVKEGNGALSYAFEYASALFWEFLFTWWIYMRHGFGVIQGCNPPDNIFLVAVPFKLFGVRYIFDHHDANPELYLSKFERRDFLYRVQLWLEKLTYRMSDVVMTTNASYRDLAISRGECAPENVFIVRNGPDLDTFAPVPPNTALKKGKPYLVGYVGTMSFQEGLDLLLEAARQLRDMGRRDIQFICIGGGPGLTNLRETARETGLDDMVYFTGRIPTKELLEILSTADVCVNPDRPCEMNNISTMIKIMEYMALAKPIVQFDLKEGRFSAQEASLYADKEGGVSDFVAKILWLLDNSDERQRMGQLGRRRVENQLAWQYSVPHLLAAYRRAFRGEARGTAFADVPSNNSN